MTELLVKQIGLFVGQLERSRELTVEFLADPAVEHREFWQGHLDHQTVTLAYWRGQLAHWQAVMAS